MHRDDDRDYERIFFENRQVSVTHFFSVARADDGTPIKFAFGYWTPDGVFHQGFVEYDKHTGFGQSS